MPATTTKGETLRQRREASVARGVSTAHPIWIERGSGANVWDSDGKRYYDFVGGIGTLAVGHAHPKITAAIAEQAKRFTHICFQVAGYEPYVQVAEELNRRLPDRHRRKRCCFRPVRKRPRMPLRSRANTRAVPQSSPFSTDITDATLLALSMTGKNAPYKQHFGPFCSEIYHAPFPYEHHGMDSARALASLDALFESSVTPDRVAAIIIEPVLGEGGFVPAPPAFLHGLREICDRHGIVLIFDEIQTGFGRTGTFFAAEHYGIEPDLVTVAKSLAGGMPLAAVAGKAEIMDAPLPGGLGGTFAGNPVACAAALATFEIMDEAFFERARAIGERVRETLVALKKQFPAIEDVRGLGPMLAIELTSGGERIVEEARERGLLLLLAGKRNVIRILVPLVIDDEELSEALDILTASTSAALS